MLYDAILFIWLVLSAMCYFPPALRPRVVVVGSNLETNLNVAEEISYLKPLSLLITSVCQVGYKEPQKYQLLLLLL